MLFSHVDCYYISNSKASSCNIRRTYYCMSFEPQQTKTVIKSAVNIPLQNIKNIRDLSTASEITAMLQNKIFRTGCVSKASDEDARFIRDEVQFRALIDLRSHTELEEDENLKASVYEGYSNYHYNKKTSSFELDKTNISDDVIIEDTTTSIRKRFFISLIDESVIKKGIFARLRKRTKTRALLLLLLSSISKRAGKKVRGIFIACINEGGLKLLNEILIDNAGKEIVQVLKLLVEVSNAPAAVYCTAGKDRTGLISMLVLSILGATDEEIIADYTLSDSAYKDINDKKAMVASLQQTDVDPDLFLGAKADVIEHVLSYIRLKYGSVSVYLTKFGFDQTWRDNLRNSLTAPNLNSI